MSKIAAFAKAKQAMQPGYRMLAKGAAGEIWLYGVIGSDWFGDGVTAKQFAADLRALGDVSTIDLRVNSDGGLVTDARAMWTLLVEHKAKITTHIDGIAASAASFVALAGDEIIIAEGGFIMIHNARGGCYGEAKDMRDAALVLELVNGTMRDTYAARTKQTTAQIEKWMNAETWFTGAEAVKYGFADRIVENVRVAACVSSPERFKNLPAALGRPRIAEARALIASR
jgi:ATP-dependent protease ClpP protease subunit